MKENFKYKIVRNAISKDILNFVYEYFLLKRKVFRTCLKTKIIPPHLEHLFGMCEDEQVPGTDYVMYADIVGETLLKELRSKVQEETNFGRIIENYSFVRIYKRGNELKKHTDRKACKLSVTLPIGGNHWPIFIDGKRIDLEIGDMLIYEGAKYSHWRDELKQNTCTQVFIHYIYDDNPDKDKLKFDGRKTLGAFKFGIV